MHDAAWSDIGLALRGAAAARFQRRTVVVCGDAGWAVKVAEAILVGIPASEIVCVGTCCGNWETIDAARAKHLLGRELSAAVFDGHGELDGDALGAVSGSVRGGGLLLLLLPPRADIAAGPSRFLRRLLQTARLAPGVTCLFQDEALPPMPDEGEAGVFTSIAETGDQRRAVAAIKQTAFGHRRRPVVLLADRGRGKSAALGIAAAELLQEGKSRIVITGPRPGAVEVAFIHLRRSLGLDADLTERHVVPWGTAEFRFIPPDELLRSAVATDILLVDEAAGIPVAVLDRLLRKYSRIAFATTVHGYEGSGRGFVVHFNRVLDRDAPGWHCETLLAPIRWAEGDPVEAWLNDALLLDADYPAVVGDAGPLSIQKLNRDALVEQDAELKQLVGLLVQAHYRTTPDDLRYLLDDWRVSVWAAANQEGNSIGALVAADEGPLAQDLTEDVFHGRRRLRGELLPQSLLFHAGLRQAGELAFRRIVRIAVHPHRQRQGVGRALIEDVAGCAVGDGVDVLGASFAADPATIRFWQACGFVAVRMGIVPDHASGLRSVMVLRGVSPAGSGFAVLAAERFRAGFLHGLADQWRDVSPEMVMALLGQQPQASVSISADAVARLHAFGYEQGHYDACALELWQLCEGHLAGALFAGQISPEQADALVGKVLQKRPWSAMAELLQVSGKGQAQQRVREAVRALLEAIER